MKLIGSLAGACILLSACAPAPAPGGGGQDAPAAQAGPKVLTWATQREPTDLLAISGVGGTIGPTAEVSRIASDPLVVQDNRLEVQARLALELPSVEKGTWRVNPDGTMATTWKLRPNIKWQDGTPFTSADLAFWFRVVKGVPSARVQGLAQMESVSTPDDTTFVINWSSTFYKADRAPDVAPLPQHLLGPLFERGDPEAFLNSPYFGPEFVGLGPYRLTKWEPGLHMEFTRFDAYYLGRPKLDTLILQFIPDFNTMVSNALSGAVDVSLPPGGNNEAVLDVKRRWEGTTNEVKTDPTDRMRYVEIQQRAEYARPRNGLTVRDVRAALYHAIDRQTFVEVITQGQSPAADSWFSPTDPLRRDVESAIPPFPFDLARARQLFAQAGWTAGGDGTLTHQGIGDRFEVELWNRPGSGTQRELEIIAEDWKTAGVAPAVVPVPVARANDREYLTTYPGVLITNPPVEDLYIDRLNTRYIAAPENRWTARNGSGYSNPAGDELQARLLVTIDRNQGVTLHRQLLQTMMGDVPIMPLYWEVRAAFVQKGVKGTVSGFQTGWNIFEWAKG